MSIWQGTPPSDPEGGRPGMSRRTFLHRVGQVAGAGALVATAGWPQVASALTPAEAAASAAPRRGGTLRAGMTGGGTDDTLNPLTATNYLDFTRIGQLYDQLIMRKPDYSLETQLAEEVNPNHDASVWTIRLRPGVTFHDGKPLTADDVIYTFKRIVNPKNPGTGASSLGTMDAAGLKKVDKLTLTVPFKSPFVIFRDVIASDLFCIIPVGFNPKAPIGTGPFKLKSFTPGTESVFVRNPDYWEPGKPYVDSFVVTDYADESSQVNALLSGQVDMVNLLSAESIEAVQTGGAVTVISDGGPWNPFTMRVDVAPFNDVRVRQAFRFIVNRRQMLDDVFDGHGRIGNDMFGIFDPLFDHSIPQREQDLDLAKSLLKQAGHDGLTVELVTSDIAQGVVRSAQVFAEQAKGAGVNVNLRQVTVAEFFGSNYLKWPFAQDWWGASPYLSQAALCEVPHAPWNETHFNNPTYLRKFHAGISATATASRRADIHAMQEIDYNSSGYIIPYFSPTIDGYSKKVKGAVPTLNGGSFNDYNVRDLWLAS